MTIVARTTRLSLLCLVGFVLVACAHSGEMGLDAGEGRLATGAAASPSEPSVQPEIARATLDSAWRRIANTYYDTTFRGVDWPAVHAELAPVADTTTSMSGLRALVGDMLSRLGESHLTLIPSEAVPDPSADQQQPAGSGGWSGVNLRLLGSEVVVSEVEAGSPAELSGVRTGWVLLHTRQDTSARLLERARLTPAGSIARRDAEHQVVGLLQARLKRGAPGDTVRATFADGDDNVVVREMVLVEAPGEVVQFGNLPPLRVRVEHQRLTSPVGCVSYVYLGIWMPAAMPAVERAIDADSSCSGLVLDLRGNPGGVGGLVIRIGGLLLNEPIDLGTMRTRSASLKFVVNPRRVRTGGEPASPFAGRVAIIVDEFSMSTSEIVAASLQEVGRARVFGVPTTGQALPSGMVRLPSGDVLLHAVADYRTPGGRRVEGEGVHPDEVVPLTRRDLVAGRDAPLRAAVSWITSAPATTVP